MSYVAFLIYRHFLVPISWLGLQIIALLKRGKIWEIVQAKNSQQVIYNNNMTADEIHKKRPFWIHAASGEIEYARPVIRELKQRFPEIPILVTYNSPSAKKILQSIPQIDAWCAQPWETPWSCREFIKRFQPRAWLVARTDVWPEIALTVSRHKIPALLFSATFAENSSRLRGFGLLLNRFALENLSQIFVVSADDQLNLAKLNLSVPVEIKGDTRFDQVFHRLENPKDIKLKLRPQTNEPIFVCGSTWPEDEKVIISALADVHIRTIIAPHEISENHLQNLASELKKRGRTSCRYSQVEAWSTDVLLIDSIGILAEIYQWGHMAFVGGSFRKQVHSVMEPLAAGLPVLVGPFHRNNREAIAFQGVPYAHGKLVTCIQQSAELSAELKKILSQNETTEIKEQIQQLIKKQSGATAHVAAWVKNQPSTI